MTECVNLRSEYGCVYQIFFDRAYDTKGVHSRNLDPWMMTLRGAGKGVELYPNGGTSLRVDIDHRTPTANKLLKIDGVELVCDADDGKTLEFDVEQFEAVDEILKFRRRPNLSPEVRTAKADLARSLRSNRGESNQGRA